MVTCKYSQTFFGPLVTVLTGLHRYLWQTSIEWPTSIKPPLASSLRVANLLAVQLYLVLLTKALWASNCGVVLQRAAPCWIKELEGICWICFCCCLCGIFLGICCDCRRFCDSNIGSSLCFKGVNRDTNEWLIWGVLRSLLDITTNAAMDLLDT